MRSSCQRNSDYNRFNLANSNNLLLMPYCHDAAECQDTCELGPPSPLEPLHTFALLPRVSRIHTRPALRRDSRGAASVSGDRH